MNIFNYAITNNDAGQILLYSDGQPGHTSIYSSQIPKLRISDFKVYTCYTTTIDKTLDRYFGEPNYFTEYLIKVDVEGAELEVLQSAKETIKHLKPTWVIEVHPHVDMADIRAFLIERGYIIYPLFTYAPCHYIKAVMNV